VVNEARSAPYRAWDYLSTPEDVREYLNAALEDGDERVLRQALRNIADAYREGRLAGDGPVLASRELDRLLDSGEDPRLSSLNGVLKAMGLALAVRPVRDAA